MRGLLYINRVYTGSTVEFTARLLIGLVIGSIASTKKVTGALRVILAVLIV